MWTYIVKRLLLMLITLAVITVVSYAMMRIAPGDPVRAKTAGAEEPTKRADEKDTLSAKLMREKYHLDKSWVVGYAYWLKGVLLRNDWGSSIIVDPKVPVMRVIRERLAPTIKLEVISLVLIYATAIPIGIYAAIRRNRLSERGITIGLFVLYSLPSFWVALLLMMFFCSDRYLQWFPVAGLAPDMGTLRGMGFGRILLETARHYVLPVFCLTYGGLAGLSRYARVGLLEVLQQDYIRTARAKGLPAWKVIGKHVLRNGLIPMVTIFAGILPSLIGGAVIIETVFSIPGMGSLSFMALVSRDYPLIMALFTIGAMLTLLGLLLSDILYAIVDPRIHYA